MLQYEIHNKMKRSGCYETVLMMKYVVSPPEKARICAFLASMDDCDADRVRMAINRTERVYERKYKTDPVAPDGSLAFILFKPDSAWLQQNCLNKLFTYDNPIVK